MYFVLTPAGEAAIEATPGVPPVLAAYKLGSGFNYTPSGGQGGLVGSTVYSGVPSTPIVENPNLVRYVITIDDAVGGFSFGEVGLFMAGNVLFAVGSSSVMYAKNVPNPSLNERGNQLSIDCYITTSGTNYDIYSEMANNANPFSLPRISTVDALPLPETSATNAYIVGSPADPSLSILAIAYQGIWGLTGYDNIINSGEITSVTGTTILVPAFDNTDPLTIGYEGEVLVQFITGPLTGTVRTVDLVSGPGPFSLSVSSGYNVSATPGDKFILMKRVSSFNPDLFQAKLKDTNGGDIPLGTLMMTKAQVLAAITSSQSTVAAENITGLPEAIISELAGDSRFTLLTDAFGVELGRLLPT